MATVTMTSKIQITVGVLLKSGMWQIMKLNLYPDQHGATQLPMAIQGVQAWDRGTPRMCDAEFYKANKRGKWFYKEATLV